MLRVYPHVRVIVGAVIASLVLALALPASYATADPGTKLSKRDREAIATAAVNGQNVTLLFATVESATGSVAAALQALGATVRKQDRDVGYIRADVPADKAEAAAKIAGVVAVEADQVFEIPQPGAEDPAPQATPDETTPAENPYMPTRDIGAPQFVAANPTWDGRGTTIGILDTGVDLGHPALQTTTTGERKIVDWLTYTDPATEGDPSWVPMTQIVTVIGGTFTVGTGASARTYTGAPDGTWRYGEFSEDHPTFANTGGSAAAEYRITCANRPGGGGDLDRDGNCGDVFAILWDGNVNGVTWRDSDADLSFADESAMGNYKTTFDIGEYGHDNPATAVRESVPFISQVHPAGFVSLGIVSGAHGTHVAGIAAGNRLFGEATGVAPGAKIVAIRVCLFTSGCTAHALTEGMIYAAKDANVDVIQMSIGGLPSLNDGNNARAILYNRLIDKWGAQIFLSAGNSGPGVNTIGDPAVATKAMAIGAYWTSDSVRVNYGNVVPGPEALHDFSSRGPREDGGLKPQVVAPGNATSSVPTWQAQQCVAPIVCSPGLGMFNGTSMAAPQASGAAALLLSAAIPSEVGHKPEQLRMALTSSARFLTNYQAHEQGFGLINVGAAWDLLRTNLKTQSIDSSVPVNSKLSGFLATPGRGRGIYEREGRHPGDASFTRTYTFTRTDGGGGTYDLRWLGNESGAFSLPAGQTTLTIGNKGSAELTITVRPGAASGVNSALLLLDDPKTAGIEYATMNTIITSIKLDASNNYTASVSASASKFQAGQPKAFFSVPLGATAMRMTITVTNNGRVNATPVHPYGVPLTGTGFVGTGTPGASASLVITTGPTDGVWEVVSAASRAAIPDNSTYTVTFEAYKVTLSPNPLVITGAAIGTPVTSAINATNDFAAASTVNTVSPTLSSVRTVNNTIADGAARQSYDITVPAGLASLNVSIGNASDLGADLDLYLFNCTTGTCVPAGSGTTSAATESVTVNNPAAGLWRAEVDPFAVPAGTTTYTYSDSFARPTASPYGTLTTPSNTATSRASGATWSFDVTATALQPAGEGRFLRGSAQVRLGSATGPILGSATVEVR